VSPNREKEGGSPPAFSMWVEVSAPLSPAVYSLPLWVRPGPGGLCSDRGQGPACYGRVTWYRRESESQARWARASEVTPACVCMFTLKYKYHILTKLTLRSSERVIRQLRFLNVFTYFKLPI
jgi:hypothetical protein